MTITPIHQDTATGSTPELRSYYGGLLIMEHEGQYYWILVDHDFKDADMTYLDLSPEQAKEQGIERLLSNSWVPIDKELYDALLSWETRRPDRP